ncbi:ComEC/Rec2-related protein [Alkalispirochaeta americana]|uniref:ComEC/Rec2-related protein n=1 Tax=Alkalispirochaeta americana TaxID=159291 RepID=A0A1N6WQV7_9SPIO|nr:ComEC/Rec2 family competence protein [Alkalispirochaeta americana]SIQ92431.1 ComEC/Rec2-related protein [Alkalispirochaeta americana]
MAAVSVLTAPEVWASLIIFGGLSLRMGLAGGMFLFSSAVAVLVLISTTPRWPNRAPPENPGLPGDPGLPEDTGPSEKRLSLVFLRLGAGCILGLIAVIAGEVRIAAADAPLAATIDPRGGLWVSGTLVDDLRPGTSSLRRIELAVDRAGDRRGWQGDARGRVVVLWRGSEYLHAEERRIIPLRGDRLIVSGLDDLPGLDHPGQASSLWVSEDQLSLLPGRGPVAVRRVVRNWMRRRLARLDALGGPLILALLLGDRGALSEDLSGAVRSAGASHALALSGMHLGVLALILYAGPARFLPYRLRGVAVLPLLAGYVWVAGFIPSLVRAFVLIALISLARFRGRKTPLPVLLARTVCLVALVAPGIVQNVGFQLSLLALLGIVVAGPPLVDGLSRFLPRRFAEYTGVSLAAMVATGPISWFSFGTIYPAGILFAGLLSSLVVLVMWCGLVFLLTATLPGLGSFLAMLIRWQAQLLFQVARLGGSIPGIVRTGDRLSVWSSLRASWEASFRSSPWALLILGAIIAGGTGCIIRQHCLQRNQSRSDQSQGRQLQKESNHESQLDF